METLRRIGLGELEYTYQSAKARMDFNPEYADEKKKIVEDHPYYTNEQEALQAAIEIRKSGNWWCQIWAKIGRDEECYYIQDHYIVSDNPKVIQAAEYIGMAHLYSA